MKDSARAVALRVLIACRKNDAWADAALKAALSSACLNPSDAALCSRIVYGVLQNRAFLDYHLAACCSQKLEKLQPPLADILRIGAYQLLFLDRVPASAAVNESVQLSKDTGRAAAAGLVNAVLRRLDRGPLPELPGEETERLCVQYSHPQWLVEKLQSLIGEETEALLRLHNETAPLTVQVNPLKTSPEDLQAEFAALGVAAVPHRWVSGSLLLSGVGDIAALPPFREGRCTVQDPAASLVAAKGTDCQSAAVLDVCAAPGGKSFGAAFSMAGKGEIIACDLHENKLRRIREGAKRLGITNIRTEAADGRVFRPEWENAFDTVLCDVPCSGLGILRKKPDIRYKDPKALGELPAIQRDILSNASRYVKPGGVLMYSTCTVLPEENEQQTDAFLAAHRDFSYEGFSLGDGRTLSRVTLWPHRDDTDGFYICKMRKQT